MTERVDRARREIGRMRRQVKYFDLLRPDPGDRAVVGYVGWTGEGNIGDESMFLAHQLYLKDVARLVPLPSLPSSRLLRSLAHRLTAVCLGGGTLIGNGHFGTALSAVMSSVDATTPFFMIGTGCEDLLYRTGRRAAVDNSFARWLPMLDRFDEIRVRGPLSVEVLASLGVAALDTGDPALALPMLHLPTEPGLIGVNIGVTDDQWGGSSGNNQNFAEELIGALLRAGYQVRLCPSTNEDHAFSVAIAKRWNGRVQAPSRGLDVLGFLHWVGACQGFIGLKLHAQILASTQRVPVIALEYRPKCADFMQSIDRSHRCMRTDSLDIPELLRWLSEDLVASNLPAIIDRSVSRRQQALARAFVVEKSNLRRRHGHAVNDGHY